MPRLEAVDLVAAVFERVRDVVFFGVGFVMDLSFKIPV